MTIPHPDAKEAISFASFASSVEPSLELTAFHNAYYRTLEAFAHGRIRRLLVTMPPQHGKSLGATVLLPAYLLGLNPALKVAIASYNALLASRFNRRVQRLIDSAPYAAHFPATTLKAAGTPSHWVRTSEWAEIVGTGGELFSVGRGGSLTGNRVDVLILDDLYKDAMEANSPLIRDNCWEWYTSVVRTRMHNLSQELLVFTRWHEEDLAGRLARIEPMTTLERWEQLEGLGEQEWLRLDFPALKEGTPTEADPRNEGEPLWPERHSRALLEEKRRLDALRFDCLYQGRPSSPEGLLYGDTFAEYVQEPEYVRLGNYTDTADTGDDYLCSVCYGVDTTGRIHVREVVYSRERMEVTEQLVADMIRRTGTRDVLVESNNGGRGFARAVGRLVPECRVEWFHQGANKEARILSNASLVGSRILMPEGWKRRWPDFAAHLVGYRRLYRANRWHDAPDVLTGIAERECGDPERSRIRRFTFKVK